MQHELCINNFFFVRGNLNLLSSYITGRRTYVRNVGGKKIPLHATDKETVAPDLVLTWGMVNVDASQNLSLVGRIPIYCSTKLC